MHVIGSAILAVITYIPQTLAAGHAFIGAHWSVLLGLALVLAGLIGGVMLAQYAGAPARRAAAARAAGYADAQALYPAAFARTRAAVRITVRTAAVLALALIDTRAH